MRRSLTLVLCVFVALAVTTLARQTEAAKPDAPGSRTAVRQILPDETEPSELRGNRRISLDTGVPLALYRLSHRMNPGRPEAMAAQYLRDNAAVLHIATPSLSDLEHRRTWESPAGSTVRFQQHVDGVPVYGAEIAVTLDRDARVVFVMNGYKPHVTVGSINPVVTSDQARLAALDYLDVQGGTSFERTRLVVYRNRRVSRLAWEVRLIPVGQPNGDWEVLLDARTGRIFKVADRALYVDGSGNIFDPDPLSSAGAAYGDPGFTDGSDADTPELNAQLMTVPLRDITFDGTNHNLVGPWAAIVDFESPIKGTFAQASSQFLFNRNQDGFEAVNTYYHLDNIMRHINVDLGLSITPFQYSGGVQFDPHGLSGSDNSHYLSGSGRVSFGEGGVDDAEDADVVIHELGHGLHDWVTGGSLSQVTGLSEGFGDYLAQSYSRSLGQWTPADPQYHWVFGWDGHNPFWSGRTTNYGAIYPGGLTGQIHTDGQIWSTCNMLVWDQIGRANTDRAMLVALGMTNSGSNQEDAAQAMLQAAVNLGYSPTDVATMESVFQGCGYDVTTPCNPTCGNNVIECTETCDGTDLGGETCGTQGCGGGTLACNSTCDGLDTSGCSDCVICDNDGTCELGEDCNGCANDCVSGISPGAECGNGICETADGEDCQSCELDCNGKQNGKPANRFCCGLDVDCTDARCSSGGFSCTQLPVTPGSFCCGDLMCDSGEVCSNCSVDCTLGAEVCTGGADEDCDGLTDCADPECAGDAACQCAGIGESCREDTDCCLGLCSKGNPALRVCLQP